MYVNYLNDRLVLGYDCDKDVLCSMELIQISDDIFIGMKTLACKVKTSFVIVTMTFIISVGNMK